MNRPLKDWRMIARRGGSRICSKVGMFVNLPVSRSFSGLNRVNNNQHVRSGMPTQHLNRSVPSMVQKRRNAEQLGSCARSYTMVSDCRVASAVRYDVDPNTGQSTCVLNFNGSSFNSLPKHASNDTFCYRTRRHYSQGHTEMVEKKLLHFSGSSFLSLFKRASNDTLCYPLMQYNQGLEGGRELLAKKFTSAMNWNSSAIHMLSKRTSVNTPSCGQARYYSQEGRETVEKKLLHLMERWEMEEAVGLLRQSVEEGVVPHANVVLDLQQQLANLGDVDCLLDLHDFLKDHNLSSDTKFFQCLQEAYYNSGRISEGVAVLRLLYHRTRVFADVEVYFTLLTVMVLQHFPDRLQLILDFVTDLKDAEIPVLEPEASLWKCYIMMDRWSDADDLILSNEELRPLLPRQVARICQGVDRVQFDQAAILTQMLNLPFIRQKLKILVAETLIAQHAKEKHWLKLLKTLSRLKTLGLPLHADKLSEALDDMKRYLTPQYDEQLQELQHWCDSLQGESKE